MDSQPVYVTSFRCMDADGNLHHYAEVFSTERKALMYVRRMLKNDVRGLPGYNKDWSKKGILKAAAVDWTSYNERICHYEWSLKFFGRLHLDRQYIN